MKTTITVAAIALLASGALVGAVDAQTTTPSPTTTAPHSTMPVTAAPGAATTPGVNTPSLGASSQPAPARATSTAPAAVSTTTAPSRTNAAPVAGANSFTEGQARSRIEEKGFGQVTGLKKDDKGVWHGSAMKDGKSVSVALDYQGNIVTQ